MTRQCARPDCIKPILAKGLCSPCYHKEHKRKKAELQCTHDQCIRPVHQKSLCHSHYHRLYTHGDVNAGRSGQNARRDWLLKVVQDCLANDTQECVDSHFGQDSGGYGEIRLNGQRIRMHVASVILSGRERPTKGKVVRHICGNAVCVNPHHLVVGTVSQNVQDSLDHGTFKIGQEHPAAKLTVEAVIYARSSNKTYEALAEELGVSYRTLYNARTGKTWKHVDYPPKSTRIASKQQSQPNVYVRSTVSLSVFTERLRP